MGVNVDTHMKSLTAAFALSILNICWWSGGDVGVDDEDARVWV